jgi:hypothetical protein
MDCGQAGLAPKTKPALLEEAEPLVQCGPAEARRVGSFHDREKATCVVLGGEKCLGVGGMVTVRVGQSGYALTHLGPCASSISVKYFMLRTVILPGKHKDQPKILTLPGLLSLFTIFRTGMPAFFAA